jgi:hypothetical protein
VSISSPKAERGIDRRAAKKSLPRFAQNDSIWMQKADELAQSPSPCEDETTRDAPAAVLVRRSSWTRSAPSTR